MTIWMPVRDWEGFYEASDLGEVRNVLPRKGTRVGLILKGRPNEDGYLKVVLQRPGQKQSAFVHRVVFEAFRHRLEEEQEVDHLDFVRSNNTLANLEAVTRKVNIERSFAKGRQMARGSRQGRAVFTETQVMSIIQRVADGETQKTIASEFNVTPTAINCIVRGKTWRHVSPQGVRKI